MCLLLLLLLLADARYTWKSKLAVVDLRKPSCSQFCPKFRCHGNGGRSRENAIGSIRWPIPENPRIGSKISQKSLTQALYRLYIAQRPIVCSKHRNNRRQRVTYGGEMPGRCLAPLSPIMELPLTLIASNVLRTLQQRAVAIGPSRRTRKIFFQAEDGIRDHA